MRYRANEWHTSSAIICYETVAFVTGRGSGIGLHIGESAGGVALSAAGDVREYSDCEEALRRVRDAFGAVDILVCGAAGNFPAPVLGVSSNGLRAFA